MNTSPFQMTSASANSLMGTWNPMVDAKKMRISHCNGHGQGCGKGNSERCSAVQCNIMHKDMNRKMKVDNL